MSGTKIYDDAGGPVNNVDADTFPSSPDKSMAVSGRAKIFQSDGSDIDSNSPLPVSVTQGAAGTVFGAAVDEAAGGSQSSDNPIFLLKNPVGSGVTLRGVEVNTGVVEQNRSGKWNFYINPTITADGTSLAETNLDQTSAGVSSAQAFSSPTISANGILFNTVVNGQNANSSRTGFDKAVLLGEGDSLLVTCKPSANNAKVTVSMVWTEV